MRFLETMLLLVASGLGQPDSSNLPAQVSSEPAAYKPIVNIVLPEGAPEPVEAPPPEEQELDAYSAHRLSRKVELWGQAGIKGYYAGSRMAPNGYPFNPLFSLTNNFNIGILPDQKVYLFIETQFWGQKADPAGHITNPTQGAFDFSKREFDLNIGFAWNYYGPMEFRVFGYSQNNLNRGVSPLIPEGYNDGVGLENRFYLPTADKYDMAKRGFVSFGYYPTKTMVTGDGQPFKPGFFARGYVTWDLPWPWAYLYLDGQFLDERYVKFRLFNGDTGLAIRPFTGLQSVEFRLGVTDTVDFQVPNNRWLGYGAFQIVY